jgi:hypothetical protein
MADLYHITRKADARAIFRQGLVRGKKSPAAKKAERNAREASVEHPEVMEDPPDVRADWKFDDILRDAQRAAEGAEQYPDHSNAVFFWETERDAHAAIDNTPWAGVIVAVESDALPDRCECAIGDHHEVSSIWHTVYDAFRGRAHMDEQELYEGAIEWWEDVEFYNKYDSYAGKHEVWCGCDVPPRAIEHIETADGRVMYEPEPGPTLWDFLPGGDEGVN